MNENRIEELLLQNAEKHGKIAESLDNIKDTTERLEWESKERGRVLCGKTDEIKKLVIKVDKERQNDKVEIDTKISDLRLEIEKDKKKNILVSAGAGGLMATLVGYGDRVGALILKAFGGM